MCYVLDSSAVIAALYQEAGSEEVKPHLADGIMSTVNATEVLSYITDAGASIKQAIEILDNIDIFTIPYSREHANLAADLKSRTKKYGLSLGDRACFALAMEKNLHILTADRTWAQLDLGIKIKLIR